MAERPSGPGTAFANFLIDTLPALGMTNDAVAAGLGYAHPTIISMWKTGRTKVTLDVLQPLSELLGVDLGYLLALYFEQYVTNAHGGVTKFAEILDTVRRIVTPEEMKIIDAVRVARRGNSLPMTKAQKAGLSELFAVSSDTPEGPYGPSRMIDTTKIGIGDRTRFERRGMVDYSVTEEKEAETRPQSKNHLRKVKRVAAGRREKMD